MRWPETRDFSFFPIPIHEESWFLSGALFSVAVNRNDRNIWKTRLPTFFPFHEQLKTDIQPEWLYRLFFLFMKRKKEIITNSDYVKAPYNIYT